MFTWQWLNDCNMPNGRNLMYKTKIIHEPSDDGIVYCVKHWDTILIRFYPNREIGLSNGGHFSNTTKKRLNKYSSLHVFQKKWIWYVDSPRIDMLIDWRELGFEADPYTPIEFYEGMRWNPTIGWVNRP